MAAVKQQESTSSPDWTRIGVSATLSGLLVVRSWRRKSLTRPGCIAAFGVGYLTASSGWIPFAALLSFFMSSTFITKFGKTKKKKIDPEYNPKGNRTLWQVLCNGGSASALILGYSLLGRNASFARPVIDCTAPWGRAVVLAIVGHYAACQGDTWSSELGVLSPFQPRLITTLRKVPTGTNGAVSFLGLGAAAAGGALIAAVCSLVQRFAPTAGITSRDLWAVSLASALGGTLLDSLLGATLQFSGLREDGAIVAEMEPDVTRISGIGLLSNNTVNFVSATAVLAAVLAFSGRGGR